MSCDIVPIPIRFRSVEPLENVTRPLNGIVTNYSNGKFSNSEETCTCTCMIVTHHRFQIRRLHPCFEMASGSNGNTLIEDWSLEIDQGRNGK